jgi:hypothetical protein
VSVMRVNVSAFHVSLHPPCFLRLKINVCINNSETVSRKIYYPGKVTRVHISLSYILCTFTRNLPSKLLRDKKNEHKCFVCLNLKREF